MLSFKNKTLAGKAVIAATLAATTLGGLAATPAQAQSYRGHHRGGDDAGVAIGAGLLGLAVGAAIASSDRPHYYYRERYYEPAYYPPAYYGRPYPVYRQYYREDWRWHHRRPYYGGYNGYGGYGYGYGYGHGWRHR